MKAKYTVTIVKETQIMEMMDENMAKDILSGIVQLKLNPFEQTMRSEMKVDKDRLSLKNNRKWFNRFKSIKLSQILKFFLFDIAPEYILINVAIDKFCGYIVLKIDIAGCMIEFTDYLKQSTEYIDSSTTSVNGNSDKHSEDQSSTATVVIHESQLLTLNGEYLTNGVDHDHEIVTTPTENTTTDTEPEMVTVLISPQQSQDSIGYHPRKKFIVIDDSGDALTYVNYNSREVVVDDGPVSLYSQTYPSVYNRNNTEEPDYWDCVESESDDNYHDDNDF